MKRSQYDTRGVHCAAVNCGSPRVGFEVTLSIDVVDALGWSAGEKVQASFLPEINSVVLERSEYGYGYRLLKNGHKLRFRTTAYPADVGFAASQRKTPVTFAVSGRRLSITLPDWFYGGSGADNRIHNGS